LLVVALYARRLRREVVRQERLLRTLERDMQAVWVGARGVGDAVGQLEERLRRLTERQDQLALREPGQQVYHQAIRLARRGAGVDELVATCGLAQGEAELIHVLHRATRPEPAGTTEEPRRARA
jgi:hypothetical protein